MSKGLLEASILSAKSETEARERGIINEQSSLIHLISQTAMEIQERISSLELPIELSLEVLNQVTETSGLQDFPAMNLFKELIKKHATIDPGINLTLKEFSGNVEAEPDLDHESTPAIKIWNAMTKIDLFSSDQTPSITRFNLNIHATKNSDGSHIIGPKIHRLYIEGMGRLDTDFADLPELDKIILTGLFVMAVDQQYPTSSPESS